MFAACVFRIRGDVSAPNYLRDVFTCVHADWLFICSNAIVLLSVKRERAPRSEEARSTIVK